MTFNRFRDIVTRIAATAIVFAACSLALAYVVSGGHVERVPDWLSMIGGWSILTLCATGPLAAVLWIWRDK